MRLFDDIQPVKLFTLQHDFPLGICFWGPGASGPAGDPGNDGGMGGDGDSGIGFGGGGGHPGGGYSQADSTAGKGWGGDDGGGRSGGYSQEQMDAAMQQSVNQSLANSMETAMAHAGFNSSQIGDAMMGFTGLSVTEALSFSKAFDNAVHAHDLSQRSLMEQFNAAVTQATVAGWGSLGVNAKGLGLTAAQGLFGQALGGVLGGFAMGMVSTPMQAALSQLAIDVAVPSISKAVMNMAHTHNLSTMMASLQNNTYGRGVGGFGDPNNDSMPDFAGYVQGAGGEGGGWSGIEGSFGFGQIGGYGGLTLEQAKAQTEAAQRMIDFYEELDERNRQMLQPYINMATKGTVTNSTDPQLNVWSVDATQAPETRGSLNLQAALSGALGPEVQRREFERYSQSAEVKFLADAGINKALADVTMDEFNQSRVDAINKFNSEYALQNFDTHFNRLGALTGTALTAAGALSKVDLASSQQVHSSYSLMGQANAGNILKNAQAWNDTISSLSTFAGYNSAPQTKKTIT